MVFINRVTELVAFPDVPEIITDAYPGQIEAPCVIVKMLLVAVIAGLNEDVAPHIALAVSVTGAVRLIGLITLIVVLMLPYD